jgi:serine/threonine protein phosphatase PrpC
VDGSKAWFVQVDGSDPEYAQNVAFDLGSSPQLFKAVREGNNVLRASIAQKGQSNAKALDGVLARVALLLQSNVLPGTIAFTASGDSKALLGGNGAPEPITIAVGALGAQ